MSVYPQIANDALKEPMFLGQPVNIARYDQQRHPIFEKLNEKQLSFFWRPEEVDLSTDRSDFASLTDAEQHIFTSNLKYQILMDSIQGRSPSLTFLPICSLPELETWLTTWTFSESIHSRSYTHIIRNIYSHPEEVFGTIVENPWIAKRATSISSKYDELIALVTEYSHGLQTTMSSEHKKTLLNKIRRALYLCIATVNILEAIRFYVSFACSFAFAEGEKMEGNAKIIKLVAR